MKFLFFNASVIFALYYLFSGNDGIDPNALKSKVSELFHETLMHTTRADDHDKSEPIPVEPLRAMTPVTVPENVVPGGQDQMDAKAISEASHSLKETRFSEISSQTSDGNDQDIDSVSDKTELQKTAVKPSEFMSPRQRRRELVKLAEDMDLMFISRLTR